ncbi:chaperonin 10-like protein [Mycena alexandri]|uniref:Chaperonin 10-like protein n=1 Tax=Mycena alexandri TaxID=1745969 RepID=A0AAD6SS80_9AGAR|nr:chaperonin 10-like protein [Mycena alexandri]
MSLPTTTRQYYYPELGSFDNLVLQEAPITAPKPTEVLVKTHAVSLQARFVFALACSGSNLCLLVSGSVNCEQAISHEVWHPPSLLRCILKLPRRVQPNLVPCSDMAGEIIAVGEDVKHWKSGDRICANFFLDKLNNVQTPDTDESALGGAVHGVLTQYRTFPAHSLVAIPPNLTYEEASTLPFSLRKLRRSDRLLLPKNITASWRQDTFLYLIQEVPPRNCSPVGTTPMAVILALIEVGIPGIVV